MTTFLTTLRTLDAGATPGPWEPPIYFEYESIWDSTAGIGESQHQVFAISDACNPQAGCDADLIVYLRNHAAAIIGCVEAAQAFVDSENPDREVCDNPECEICPAMTELESALAACREAMGETP